MEKNPTKRTTTTLKPIERKLLSKKRCFYALIALNIIGAILLVWQIIELFIR